MYCIFYYCLSDPKDFAKILRKIGDRVIIQREETKYQYSLGKNQDILSCR